MISKQINLKKEAEIKTVLSDTAENKKDENDNKDIVEDKDNKEDNKDSTEQKDTKENKRVREEKMEDQEDLNSSKEAKDENVNQNSKVRKIDENKSIIFCRKPDILPQIRPIHLLAKDGWRRIFCKCEEVTFNILIVLLLNIDFI
ncbi:hypothetical protein K502DRAFT_261302 [Neoconidiobolus thromboides FSU 785]|nr:hypothetical protein K502DRAFT_261302 [Neoconidiobolus thromboides FSU 785]